MSILASDFEETFASNQVGSYCKFAYIGWISYVIESCPQDFHDAMSTDILNALFHTDPVIFGEMFSSAVASTIYRLGHMLKFMRTECFIGCKQINFRKHPMTFGSKDEYKYELHIFIDGEEIIGMKLPVDPVPQWKDGEMYGFDNPYYRGES